MIWNIFAELDHDFESWLYLNTFDYPGLDFDGILSVNSIFSQSLSRQSLFFRYELAKSLYKVSFIISFILR